LLEQNGINWQDLRELKELQEPGKVVHTCNHSYLGSRDLENRGSRPAQAKSLRALHLNQLKKNKKSGHAPVIPVTRKQK
jgi:hypothetical protein